MKYKITSGEDYINSLFDELKNKFLNEEKIKSRLEAITEIKLERAKSNGN